MTPERWALLREIFGRALEAPEADRPRLLDSACNGDPELRGEVERLLSEGAAQTWKSPVAGHFSVLELAPGDMLAHLRIESKLGEGGMGIVYRAHDTRLRRQVALKVLPPEHIADPEWKRRFLREARAASALNHPNIVTVYNIGSDGDIDFISMEYVDGRPLAESIHARGLPLTRALDHAIAIAEALTVAHQAGIIHRDLKPANIMVTSSERIKLLDFGLARRLRLRDTETVTMNTTGDTAGTPHYMSPEQVRGLNLDARTDIFSFGVVFYEMLTGRRPFDGDTAAHAMISILDQDPIPVAHYVPQIPAELQRIIRKALEKNREERYQVCKDLELDLKRLRQETGTTPAPLPHAETSRVARSSPVYAADHTVTRLRSSWKIATLAAAGLLAVTAGSYLFSNRTPVFAARDGVLVADFVNTTGEPVFDGALKAALAIQLQQSPFITIFSEEQARDTLRFMGRQPDERITKAVGREICERRGIKVLLAGSIGGIGSHYVITLEAIGAASGDVVAREQAEAESKERVLQSLGGAATKLRRTLGESISSLQKYDRPLEIATTSSLEALKAWSISRRLNVEGKELEAIPYARRAIDLDPNFAMAYRALAIYYRNGGRKEQVENMQKAFDLRERASEPEKLLIVGDYESVVTRDLDKALETLKLLNRIYPNDAVSQNQLGNTYYKLGQYERAIEPLRQALRLTPSSVTYNLLAIQFQKLNLYPEASHTLDQAHFDSQVGLHFGRFVLAFLNGDEAGMKEQVDWSAAQPDVRDHLTWQSRAAAFRGQRKKAGEFADSAITRATYDDCQDVKRLTGADWNTAMALALCGDIGAAESAAAAYRQAQPPTATEENGYRIPELRSAIAIARNQPTEAIELLKPAKRFGGASAFWPEYLRGQAYLKMKAGTEAAAEFQRILDHRGFAPMSPLYPLAYLGLARAAQLTGDTVKSRRTYQDLFAIWKYADEDLPVLIEAKSEYEKLRR